MPVKAMGTIRIIIDITAVKPDMANARLRKDSRLKGIEPRGRLARFIAETRIAVFTFTASDPSRFTAGRSLAERRNGLLPLETVDRINKDGVTPCRGKGVFQKIDRE
jgi:hypothetical protein